MKRFLLFISIATLAFAALSSSSCTRLEPSEITAEAYPFTATCMVTAKIENALAPNYEMVFDITDATSGRTYTIKRTTNSTGTILLKIGCGAKGASVTAHLLADLNGTSCYGSNTASLTATTKYHAEIEVNAKK